MNARNPVVARRKTIRRLGFTKDQLRKEIRREVRSRRRKRANRGFWVMLLAVTGICFLISQYEVNLVTIRNSSVRSEFPTGSTVLFTNVELENLKTNDYVLFRYEGRTMVRKILGLPGDRLKISDDGKIVKLRAAIQGEGDKDVYVVPDHSLYVLADSNQFVDSRSQIFGSIPEGWVMGRARAVLWPLSQIHWVSD